MDWNPSAPRAAGVEIANPTAVTIPVTVTPAATLELVADTTESVASISARLDVPAQDVTLCCDVYALGGATQPWSFLGDNPAAHKPTVDVTADTTRWKRNNGGTSALYAALNEWPHTVNYTDWIAYSSAGTQAHTVTFRAGRDNRQTRRLASQVAPLPVDLTGRRVISVSVRAVASNTSEQHQATLAGVLRVANSVGGYGTYTAAGKAVPRSGEVVDLSWDWNWNPGTQAPWLNADVEQLFQSVSAAGQWGLQAKTGPTTDEVRVYAAWLVINTVAEQRVATGRVRAANTTGTSIWQDFPLVDPVTGSPKSWNKVGGVTYWVALSLSGPSSLPVSWRALNGMSDEVRVRTLPLKAGGSGALQDGDVTPLTRRAVAGITPAFLFRDTTGAVLVDSQPYYQVADQNVALGLIVEQEIVPTADSTVGIIDVAVRADGPSMPTQPLSVGLFRRSNGTQVGGTGTIEPEDITGASLYTTVPVRLPSAASVLTGVQYAVRCWSQTPVERPWLVAGLDATGGETVGYGGVSQQATIHTVDVPTVDLAVVARTVPTAPANLTVTIGTDSDPRACGIADLRYAAIEWDSTALGANFAAYEVARSESNGAWVTIATVKPEDLPGLDDYETARNVPVRYRVRVVAADGATSDWTAPSAAVTVAAGTELILASNVLGRASGYDFDGTEVEWESITAESVEYHQRWGIPMQVQARPDIDRGLRWTRTLAVGWGANGRTDGQAAFTDLLAWQAAAVPYVAIVEGTQRRYVGLVIRSMVRREPGRRYSADVEFTDVLAGAPAVAILNATTTADATYGDGAYGDGDYGT